MKGVIIKGVGGLYSIKCGEQILECRARGRFRKEQMTPLVGDFVEVADGCITEIYDRKNALIRPACANIDKLFLVTALSSPDPVIYNIDKMLAIAYYHHIEPILVFSKSDLPDVCHLKQIYQQVPIKQVFVSDRLDCTDALNVLKKEIQGCTVVLSGLSGAGKSTLMNLLGGLSLQTGSVSKKLGRGRHTTRSVELFELCGGYVSDTPGFSNLELDYFSISDRSLLADCFPEFLSYQGTCRFSDCMHGSEPGCSVVEAVQRGEIAASRWESYRKMYDQLGVFEAWKEKKKPELK